MRELLITVLVIARSKVGSYLNATSASLSETKFLENNFLA